MSRLNELEMEEQEDEDGDDRDEDHDSQTQSVEKSGHDMAKEIRSEIDRNRIEFWKQEAAISVPKRGSGNSPSIHERKYSEPSVKGKVIEVLPEKHPNKDLDDPLCHIGPMTQFIPEEVRSRGRIPQQNAGTWRDFQVTSDVSKAKATTNVVGSQSIQSRLQKPEPKFDSNKAFTGSILEHAHNLETNTQASTQSSGSQPSKPVSRFKAQRR